MLTFICIDLDRERLIHFGLLPMTQTILGTQLDSNELSLIHWNIIDQFRIPACRRKLLGPR